MAGRNEFVHRTPGGRSGAADFGDGRHPVPHPATRVTTDCDAIGPDVTRRSTARPWRADAHQAVTFVELFFDLVFVFAITQITAYTAHHLTLDGVARSILLFWLIWWAWTQFTWTLRPTPTSWHSSSSWQSQVR